MKLAAVSTLLLVSAANACGGSSAPPATPAPPPAAAPPSEPVASAEPAPEAPPAEEKKKADDAKPLPSEPLPKGVAITWSESPNLASAPANGVWASAQGRTFQVKHLAIYSDKPHSNQSAPQAWSMKLFEQAPENPTAKFGPEGASEVTVDVEQALKSGATVKRPMSPGGGYWQIIRKAGDSGTSWNADNAYALQITKWDVKPFDPKGPAYGQPAGKASGKIVLMYKGFKPEENSWVAGTFTDAPVVYDNKPYWVK